MPAVYYGAREHARADSSDDEIFRPVTRASKRPPSKQPPAAYSARMYLPSWRHSVGAPGAPKRKKKPTSSARAGLKKAQQKYSTQPHDDTNSSLSDSSDAGAPAVVHLTKPKAEERSAADEARPFDQAASVVRPDWESRHSVIPPNATADVPSKSLSHRNPSMGVGAPLAHGPFIFEFEKGRAFERGPKRLCGWVELEGDAKGSGCTEGSGGGPDVATYSYDRTTPACRCAKHKDIKMVLHGGGSGVWEPIMEQAVLEKLRELRHAASSATRAALADGEVTTSYSFNMHTYEVTAVSKDEFLQTNKTYATQRRIRVRPALVEYEVSKKRREYCEALHTGTTGLRGASKHSSRRPAWGSGPGWAAGWHRFSVKAPSVLAGTIDSAAIRHATSHPLPSSYDLADKLAEFGLEGYARRLQSMGFDDLSQLMTLGRMGDGRTLDDIIAALNLMPGHRILLYRFFEEQALAAQKDIEAELREAKRRALLGSPKKQPIDPRARFLRRLLKRQLARAFTTWEEQASERGRMLRLLKKSARAIQLNTARRAWNSWAEAGAMRGRQRQLMRNFLRRALNAAVSRAWNRWHTRTVGGARAHRLIQKVFMKMLFQRLSRAWEKWARGPEAEARRKRRLMRAALGKLVHAKLAAALETWKTSTAEMLASKDALSRALRRLSHPGARAFETWKSKCAALFEKRKLLRKQLASLRNQPLARAWRQWYGSVAEALEAKRKLRAAAARISNGGLAKAWASWAALVEGKEAREERKRLLRRATSRLMMKPIARAWEKWSEGCHAKRELRKKLGKVAGKWANMKVSRAWESWKAQVASVARLKKALGRFKNVELTWGWHRWLDYQARRKARRRAAQHLLTPGLRRAFNTWSGHTAQLPVRKLSLWERLFRLVPYLLGPPQSKGSRPRDRRPAPPCCGVSSPPRRPRLPAVNSRDAVERYKAQRRPSTPQRQQHPRAPLSSADAVKAYKAQQAAAAARSSKPQRRARTAPAAAAAAAAVAALSSPVRRAPASPPTRRAPASPVRAVWRPAEEETLWEPPSPKKRSYARGNSRAKEAAREALLRREREAAVEQREAQRRAQERELGLWRGGPSLIRQPPAERRAPSVTLTGRERPFTASTIAGYDGGRPTASPVSAAAPAGRPKVGYLGGPPPNSPMRVAAHRGRPKMAYLGTPTTRSYARREPAGTHAHRMRETPVRVVPAPPGRFGGGRRSRSVHPAMPGQQAAVVYVNQG